MSASTPEPDQLSVQMLDRIRDTDLRDSSGALAALTEFMVELGVADSVSITERTFDGELATRAATDELAMTADRIQYDLREGPCVQAAYTRGLLSSGDVLIDPRWPRWGPPAADAGVAAVISVQLVAGDEPMGALNLFYSDRTEPSDKNLTAARLAAVHASVELAHARHDAHLWRAVEARNRIGQAQGILMERFEIHDAQAFEVLRRISQDSNTKLQLVAEQLITSGDLPESDGQTDARMRGFRGFDQVADPSDGAAGPYELMIRAAAEIIERYAAEIRGGVTPGRQSELTRAMRVIRHRRDAVRQGDDLSAAEVRWSLTDH